MKFYSIFWKICIIFLIFIGIIVILNDKQSLSLFRLTIFGLCPLILSIILFKLRKNKNIIIISSNFFIMTFFALVIIEIFLLYPREPFLVSNNIYDIENKQTCGNSFKTKKNLSIYPVGGISKKKIKFLNQENLSFSFRENDRFGFNNEDKLWNLEKINSVFIGDSFTYGADVNYFESFVELYKKNVEATINLGCGGNGPIIEYATFVEYVINLNLKPDYLFWVYYPGNDLTKDLTSEHSSFYANYLKKEINQNLKSKQTEINKTIKDFIEAKKKLENKKNQKSKNTFDCITSHKRALTKEDSNRLSPFAPIVDRECWAIGSVASRFKIPFHAYKILSDKVFESGEICQQVKDKALFFSESLLNYFLETWSLEVPGPIEACDNLEKMSKDYSLHFTTSHKRKFRSLWSILLKKYSNEKEVLKKLDMDCFKEIKLSPKEKTSFLLEKMENLSTPFKSELKVKLDQSISPLKNAKCLVKFSENFEDDSMELSLKIRNNRQSKFNPI